jgi:hypothetical protein
MTAECCQDFTCGYGLGIDPIFIGSGARTSVAPGSLPTTPSSQWGVRYVRGLLVAGSAVGDSSATSDHSA